MNQCVRTEQNDQSRYAGVRESLKSSEHRGAFPKFLFIQQCHEPSRAPLHGRCAYYYTIELEMELERPLAKTTSPRSGSFASFKSVCALIKQRSGEEPSFLTPGLRDGFKKPEQIAGEYSSRLDRQRTSRRLHGSLPVARSGFADGGNYGTRHEC